MAENSSDLGATNKRVTFRTYRLYVQKLRLIAQAYNLRVNGVLSLGAALNKIIGDYDTTNEQKMIADKKKSRNGAGK